MRARKSRAFWVVPAQPVQQLFGAQGNDRDPAAGTVLMALISGMAMNDGFGGVPAFHISISQRELADRTNLSHKAVRNALQRLEKRAHITPEKASSDGVRRGTNARRTYRIDLLADEKTAFHQKGTSLGTSAGTRVPERGTSYIQTEPSDGGQTTTSRSQARTISEGNHVRPTWLTPYWDAWVAAYGGTPNAGILAKTLKPLHDRRGEAETLARWKAYLDQTPAEYVNPHRFAATWGRWTPGQEPVSELGHRESDFFTAPRR